jgi:hypothetical protein
MSPKQTSVKMDSKQESIEQPWNVVGNNDKSPNVIRDNRVANESRYDSKTSSVAEARSPFLQAAKVLPDVCDDDDLFKNENLPDDLKLPGLPEPSRFQYSDHPTANVDASMSTAREIKDVLKKINPMTNVIVKVFYGQKKLFGFPIIFKKLLDETKGNSLVSFTELHERIAMHCDDALRIKKI